MKRLGCIIKDICIVSRVEMCDQKSISKFMKNLELIWPLRFGQVSPWGASTPSLPKALCSLG